MPVLVERERQRASIDAVIDAVRSVGVGRLVLVSGEAGSGKTALVRDVLGGLPTGMTGIVGACDSLRTARPYGPISDWADMHSAELAEAIRWGAPSSDIVDGVFDLLSGGPTVAVLEDMHWADDASLDVMSVLARRIERLPVALIVTYRGDEAGPASPLSLVLGDLATVPSVKVPVPPLSGAGIAVLARGRPVDVEQLRQRTGGNAFFVTECLSTEQPVPLSVRDAVLARLHRLDAQAQAAASTLSVCPRRAEWWLIDALGVSGEAVDRCVGAGVMVAEDAAVRFRHELAREAVLSALAPGERRQLHGRVLAILERRAGSSTDSSRAAHHAAEAGDAEAVVRHAVAATGEAEAAGARREAVALLELTLRHGDTLTRRTRRELLARLAGHREVLGRHAESVTAYREAIELADDDIQRASLLLRLWNPLSFAGHLDDAQEALDRAVALLEARPDDDELGLAYAQRCSHLMLSRRLVAAEHWGQLAIAHGVRSADTETLSYALIQSGVARWMTGDVDGLTRLKDGIALARKEGLHRLVALGLSQIGSGGGENRRYGDAVPALEECTRYARDHELWSRGLYSEAWLGRCQLELGRWDDATSTLTAVLGSPRAEGVTVITALTALGRLRARRGDPDPWSPLDEALTLARHTGHLQRLWPVIAARAEAAWLEGRLPAVLDEVVELHRVAVGLDQPLATDELRLWLWRGGEPIASAGAPVHTPFALHAGGHAAVAAIRWEAIGCPYEQADALTDSPEDADQLTALKLFAELGATPAASLLVARRRAAGRSVPRGPNAATRGNTANLTARELDVLQLVASGRTNPQIAAELHLAPKTVSHHVSHVLAKLGARSRTEAVTNAIASGVDLQR